MNQISPNGKPMRSQIVSRDLQHNPDRNYSLPGQDFVMSAANLAHARREKLKWWLNRAMWVVTLCTITGQ